VTKVRATGQKTRDSIPDMCNRFFSSPQSLGRLWVPTQPPVSFLGRKGSHDVTMTTHLPLHDAVCNSAKRSSIIFLLIFVEWDWVHLVLRPLLYQAQMIDEGDCGAIGGMKTGRGNRSTRRKPAPAPLCPPHISHVRTRARTRAASVGSWRLTAWAMARPRNQETVKHKFHYDLQLCLKFFWCNVYQILWTR
jgi:hypothetical protein